MKYPVEELGSDEDDGSITGNVEALVDAIVGHRIVKVEMDVEIPEEHRSWSYGPTTGTAITLDNGRRVFLGNTDDCCAYTYLDKFLLHADKIDHIVTGIGTTGRYSKWHIFADLGDVLELDVQWSPGNPFYYGYGFNVLVIDPEFQPVTQEELDEAMRSIHERGTR